MKNKNTAIKKGWDHLGCGPWTCELNVPDGHGIIKKGITKQNDLVMVFVPPFPKRSKQGKDARVKGEWKTIDAENIGIDVKVLNAVIRKLTTAGEVTQAARSASS